MTYSFTKENVRYLYFLFGILSYWLFGAIWGQCFFFIYDLYSVMDPVMVVAGSALLELAVIFFLFRKPFFLNIKWFHVVGVLVLVYLLSFFQMFVRTNLMDSYLLSDNLYKYGLSQQFLSELNKWKNIVVALLTLAYLCWRYCAERRTPDSIARCFYGGMLLYSAFGYVFFLVCTIADNVKLFVHPMLLNAVVHFVLLLLTIGVVYQLVRKRPSVRINLIVVLAVAVLGYLADFFLPSLLLEFFTEPQIVDFPEYWWQSYVDISYFSNLIFFVVIFVIYRKTLKSCKIKNQA